MVIVLENTNKGVTMGDPYFLNLTHWGMLLGGYHGKIQTNWWRHSPEKKTTKQRGVMYFGKDQADIEADG